MVGGISASVWVSLCISVSTYLCLSCLCSIPQLCLPSIHSPSPWFLSGPALCWHGHLFSPGAHGAQETYCGPSSKSGWGGEGEGGARRGKGGPGARETRARGTITPQVWGKGGRREECIEFRRVPAEGGRGGAEPSRSCERGRPNAWGGACWGRRGGGGGSLGGQVWRQLGRLRQTPQAWRAVHATPVCRRPHARPCSECLAPMRSSSARQAWAWPRPPVLAVPHACPESQVHFSFSEEETCWRPPGRSVRLVARGQSPSFPPEGSGC